MEESPVHRAFSCSTHEIERHLLATDAQHRAARTSVQATLDHISTSTNRFTGRIRVPVVVHVVWKEEEQKVTMEQVTSQIEALNRDFNAQNKDIEDVPLPWKERVGNPNITFFLTRRDPAGQPHDGVTWAKTDVEQFSKNDVRMKYVKTGSPTWDRDRFLNIWVVNMAKNLGFAFFPGAKKELDGVVIQYTAFGTVQTASNTLSPYIIWGELWSTRLAITSIYHTWSEENYSKPLYPKINSLANGSTNANEGGDMFMNYMDYCDDDTTVMFTHGQVAMMRTTLTTMRSTVFWSSFSLPLQKEPTSFELTDSTTKFFILNWQKWGGNALIAIKSSASDPNNIDFLFTNKVDDLTAEVTTQQISIPQGSPQNSRYVVGQLEKDDKDPCLFVLKQSGTLEKITVIEAYSLSNGNKRLDAIETPLPGTDGNWSFLLAYWKGEAREKRHDVVAIKKFHTINKKVEIHVLDGASDYKNWLAHKYTALDEIPEQADFVMTDWNGDGTLDLVAISKASDGSAFSVDILAGAADYRDFLVRAEVKAAILNTHVDYDFAMTDMTGDGRPDLVAIQKSGLRPKKGEKKAKAQIIVLAG
ncbi:uncharacterized protein KY384_000869 [Bacidia gigantensis]|uniref:uncharacterized protein n=1 Tax=Bacidia gigantensis TaxID=2732470 RepID=UPI001D0439D8|nr:uncharacterized protein KY384_000869 [Bacidia gigantensis]KAG8534026.1 hypothetical protein KY384_000869 [Bacidia gigantensis]